MNRLQIALLAVVSVSTLIVASLILFVPNHAGELRTDLEVGDYYVLYMGNGGGNTRYEITEIAEDGTLHVDVTTKSEVRHQIMSSADFLINIKVPEGAKKTENRRAVFQNESGMHLCYFYRMYLNAYWVDSHGVIYSSVISGVDIRLVSCSLIIR